MTALLSLLALACLITVASCEPAKEVVVPYAVCESICNRLIAGGFRVPDCDETCATGSFTDLDKQAFRSAQDISAEYERVRRAEATRITDVLVQLRAGGSSVQAVIAARAELFTDSDVAGVSSLIAALEALEGPSDVFRDALVEALGELRTAYDNVVLEAGVSGHRDTDADSRRAAKTSGHVSAIAHYEASSTAAVRAAQDVELRTRELTATLAAVVSTYAAVVAIDGVVTVRGVADVDTLIALLEAELEAAVSAADEAGLEADIMASQLASMGISAKAPGASAAQRTSAGMVAAVVTVVALLAAL